MLLIFAIGFAKLAIIFTPNLPLIIRQTCRFEVFNILYL